MRKYRIAIDGQSYTVEVEELGGALTDKGYMKPAERPLPASELAASASGTPAASAVASQKGTPSFSSAETKSKATAQTSSPAPSAPKENQSAEEADSAGTVTANVAGKVVEINTKPGQSVKAGDVVLTLEAMKMEMPVVAPQNGIIAELRVNVGDTVDLGQVLAVLK